MTCERHALFLIFGISPKENRKKRKKQLKMPEVLL